MGRWVRAAKRRVSASVDVVQLTADELAFLEFLVDGEGQKQLSHGEFEHLLRLGLIEWDGKRVRLAGGWNRF